LRNDWGRSRAPTFFPGSAAACPGAAKGRQAGAKLCDTADRRFLEFFAATIRNKNTRMAYYRAVTEFFAWVDRHRIGQLVDIEPLHVAAYIEALQDRMAKPTASSPSTRHMPCEDPSMSSSAARRPSSPPTRPGS
jgi:hypothetical protein